jgi:hypothetical protein
MSYMDDTPRYENTYMEQLYSHNEADVGDSETQGPNDHIVGLVPCRVSSPRTLLHECYVIERFEQ